MNGTDFVKIIKRIVEVNKQSEVEDNSLKVIKEPSSDWSDMSVKVFGIWDFKRYYINQPSFNKLIDMTSHNERICKFEDFIEIICNTLRLSDDYTDGFTFEGKFKVEVGGNLETGIQILLTPANVSMSLLITEDCPILTKSEVHERYLTFIENYFETAKREYTLEYSVWQDVPSLTIVD